MPKVEQNEFSKIMLQLRDGDYKAYFDFIYLYFDDILSKLKKRK